jgi:hypothetical protein
MYSVFSHITRLNETDSLCLKHICSKLETNQTTIVYSCQPFEELNYISLSLFSSKDHFILYQGLKDIYLRTNIINCILTLKKIFCYLFFFLLQIVWHNVPSPSSFVIIKFNYYKSNFNYFIKNYQTKYKSKSSKNRIKT